MRKNYYCAIIIAILSLLIMTLTTMFCYSPKIILTACKMAVLNDNINFYNEQDIKTDKMTEEVQRDINERNKYYNSQDPLIHWFANLSTLLKLLFTLLALASYPMFLYMWLVFIALIVIKKRRAKVRKQQRRKVA